MAIVTTDNKHYSDIAAKIREATGTEEKIFPSEMPEKVAELFAEGQKAANDAFWDGWQQNGNRTHCIGMFSSPYWTEETFKPTHNMKPTNASYMFTNNGVADLKGVLERLGRTFDFSECTSFQYMTQGSKIQHFPTVDLSATSYFTDGFRYSSNLVSASLVNVSEKTSWSNSFTNCSALVDVSFSGTIGKTISFAQSSLLSDASVQNIIDVLADLTGKTAQTITFHKDVGAKLTEAQKATISAKNWTLAY